MDKDQHATVIQGVHPPDTQQPPPGEGSSSDLFQLPHVVKTAMVVFSLFVYVLCFVVIISTTGIGMAAFSAVYPVIIIGWLYGPAAGILAGLLSLPAHMLICSAIGVDWSQKILGRGEGLVGTLGLALIGWFVGYLHRLRLRLVRELAGRRNTEQDLAQHRDMLHSLNEQLTENNRLLRLGEARLQEAQHLAHIGSWEWTLETGTDFWSDEFYRILGYAPGEVKPSLDLFFDHIHPDDRELLATAHTDFDFDNPIQTMEFRIVARDGTVRYIQSQVNAEADDAGNLIRMSGTLQDVTAAKNADQELKKTRDYLDSLIMNAGIGIMAVDESGYIIRTNNALESMLGCTAEELKGKHVAEISPLDEYHIERAARMMETLHEKGFVINHETGWLRRDGSIFPVEIDISFIRDSRGAVAGGITCVRDISYRKQAQMELEKRETVLKEAQALAHVGNWERDLMADTNYWSDEYYRILGYAPGEIEPTFENFFSHIHPDDREKFLSQHMTGDIVDLDFRVVQKSGKERHVTALAKIDMNPEGMPERVHGVLMDITERKNAEEALLRYQNELESLVRERTAQLEAAQNELVKRERLSVLGRLTATVSHELRNPLGVIRSSIFFLQKKIANFDEKTAKHVARIEEQVAVCDSIVEELLEYTRGRVSEAAPGAFNEMLEQVLPLIPVPPTVRLVRHLAPDLPPALFDREKMKRVVINLVENAVQAVVLLAERQGADPAYLPEVTIATVPIDSSVRLEVADNGTGMDEDTLRHAFEPLFTTRARGTGLGLAIVQKIVAEHNGTVSMESSLGGGTRVAVCIPAQAAA
jgi:PAS domain S-box-containing protein